MYGYVFQYTNDNVDIGSNGTTTVHIALLYMIPS